MHFEYAVSAEPIVDPVPSLWRPRTGRCSCVRAPAHGRPRPGGWIAPWISIGRSRCQSSALQVASNLARLSIRPCLPSRGQLGRCRTLVRLRLLGSAEITDLMSLAAPSATRRDAQLRGSTGLPCGDAFACHCIVNVACCEHLNSANF